MPPTDDDLDFLVNVAQRHARLIRDLDQAVEAGDRDLTWRIAQAICGIEDRVGEKGQP